MGPGSRHWGNKRGVKKIKNQDAVQAEGTSARVTRVARQRGQRTLSPAPIR